MPAAEDAGCSVLSAAAQPAKQGQRDYSPPCGFAALGRSLALGGLALLGGLLALGNLALLADQLGLLLDLRLGLLLDPRRRQRGDRDLVRVHPLAQANSTPSGAVTALS